MSIDALVAFTEQERDRARDIAVELEQQIAAVDALHENNLVCQRHGLHHDCGSGHWFRCHVCAQRDRSKPCATWRITHPEAGDE